MKPFDHFAYILIYHTRNRVDTIRLATPEQIEKVLSNSDLNNESAVLSYRENLAVVKKVTELDPMYYAPEESRQQKMLFAWGIGNWLRLNGVQAYYFNVLARDEEWQKNVETFGAVCISKEPELRYKVKL